MKLYRQFLNGLAYSSDRCGERPSDGTAAVSCIVTSLARLDRGGKGVRQVSVILGLLCGLFVIRLAALDRYGYGG